MASSNKLTYATGRRKEANARVYVTPVDEEHPAQVVVNNRTLEDYFPLKTKQMIVKQPLELTERTDRYHFNVTVQGGGNAGQAGAVLLGLARALEKVEPDLRPMLKKAGFLTRDSRIVERKKPGRHKARKRPQFSKR